MNYVKSSSIINTIDRPLYVDTVLGCVRFDFIRHFNVPPTLGSIGAVNPAQAPSELWKTAVKDWIKWTGN